MIRVGDGVVLFAAVVLVVLSYRWIYADAGGGEIAEVYVNGQIHGHYTLADDQHVVIRNDHVHVELEVKDGRIRFTHSNCQNQICMQAGAINDAGRSIICAPNRVAVTIAGEGEIVTY